MNSGLVSGAQQELIVELSRRFLRFSSGSLVGLARIQKRRKFHGFLDFSLAAATRSGPGACCLVLDKTWGTTAVAAVFLALVRLQSEFAELVKNYAQSTLRRGQRIKVKPNDYVYEYHGLWEEHPADFFRLKVLDEVAYRTFRIEEALRLEPTEHVRPKGTLKSALGKFECSLLDELLALNTCGNNSIFQNTVLLYMEQARFAKAMDAIALVPEHANGFNRLSCFLPWGSIGQNGELKPNDAYQVAGGTHRRSDEGTRRLGNGVVIGSARHQDRTC